jgi:formylglycine-generating enzyme required for sulfatase activity
MSRSIMRYLVLLISIGLACRVTVPGGDFPPVTPTPSQPTPTPLILGVTGTPQIQPTSTPVPPPPTPTPRPSPTPAPTQVTTEAAGTEVTDTEAATAPTDTPAPLPGTELAEIPAGPFTMGYSGGLEDEQPEHEVDLPAYGIDIFEVTNVQFAAFVEATGYETDAEQGGSNKTWRTEYTDGKDNVPVVRVSWNDATAYCAWVGKRLPTEPEWEKAARGPEGFLYPWGNDFEPTFANGKDSGLRGPVNVGTFGEGVSPYGLFDMAGNVWEWTDSWYQAYPGNTTGSPYYGQEFRVLRGGGWFDTETELRTTRRSANVPTAANDDIGFRCAR